MSADERSVRNSLPAAQHAQMDRICTAFEAAWRRGQSPDLEDSLRGLDVPRPVRELLFAELLALEVHYRRSRRQTPSVADYQARFPEYAEQIARVFQKPPATSKTSLLSPEPPAPPLSSRDTLSTSDPKASSDSRKQPSGTRPPSTCTSGPCSEITPCATKSPLAVRGTRCSSPPPRPPILVRQV